MGLVWWVCLFVYCYECVLFTLFICCLVLCWIWRLTDCCFWFGFCLYCEVVTYMVCLFSLYLLFDCLTDCWNYIAYLLMLHFIVFLFALIVLLFLGFVVCVWLFVDLIVLTYGWLFRVWVFDVLLFVCLLETGLFWYL